MARVAIFTHGPTGLRYKGGGRRVGTNAVHWELADHPGAVGRDDTTGRFTAVCHECCEDTDCEYFTQAMQFLAEHIERHRGKLRVLHRTVGVGYVCESSTHDLHRTRCTHVGCSWYSPWGACSAVVAAVGYHLKTHIDNPTPSRKETTMRTLATVETELELAQARLEKLIAERDRLAKRPAEPSRSLITFDICFTDPGTKYSYAARKAAGLWWVTGREGARGRTWEEMLDFMSQDADVQAGHPITFRVHRFTDGNIVRGE